MTSEPVARVSTATSVPPLRAISGATRTFALLGHPVRHSLSPWIHNRLLQAHGVDAVYVALRVDPRHAQHVSQSIRALGLAGVNLTVPLKEAVFADLDACAPSAIQAGAANVVVTKDDRLIGHNTDAEGFLSHLRTLSFRSDRPAVVLGAGGAGRAVASALLSAGVTELHLLNRTESRAHGVAQALSEQGIVRAGALRPGCLSTLQPALVVNAVSGQGRSAVAALSTEALPERTLWMDLNYWDAAPPHRAALNASGHHFDDGWGMLVAQAVRAFTLFTGVPLSLSKAHALLGPRP